MENVTNATTPATMSRPQAAAYLGLAESTLQRWWARDVGPRGIKLGNDRRARVFYARGELDRFVAAGMPLAAAGARPKSVPRGCFEPPARGRPRRAPASNDARAKPG